MPRHSYRFPSGFHRNGAIVVTVSDRSARGERPDASGPRVADILTRAGFAVVATVIVPDRTRDLVEVLRLAARSAALVVTTGGTGFGPRDVTPEATARVVQRLAPGLGEAMRSAGAAREPRAWLSRGIAGLRGRSLIVNLPGSPAGAAESIEIILPLLPHALAVMPGGDPHVRAAETVDQHGIPRGRAARPERERQA